MLKDVNRPGDHVLWRNEEVVRPAIVQSVNATERTALVLLPDTGAIELAPLLELDAHGTLDHTGSNPHAEVFGVRRGDFVFVHTPGTTNGLPNPRVPRIGEVEAWVREDPFDTSGWRQELNDIGLDITPKQEQSNCGHGSMRRPTKHDGKLHWCGEVTWVCEIRFIQYFVVSSQKLTRHIFENFQLVKFGWHCRSHPS